MIEIANFLGVNTFSEKSKLQPGQFTELKNLKPLVDGSKLVKTFGFGIVSGSLSATGTVRNFVTHIDSNLTDPTGYKYCVLTVDGSNVLRIYRYNPDLPGWQLLSLSNTYYHQSASNPIIQTYNAIRFLPGNKGEVGSNECKGLWYGHLTRNFFWNSAIKSIDGWAESALTPNNDDYYISGTNILTSESGGTLAGGTYYYKYVAVFDGIQEALLPEIYDTATVSANHIVYIKKVFSDLNTKWNNRITAIKVYKSENYSANYKHAITLNLPDTDPNLTYNTNSIVGYGFYVANKAWTTDQFANKYPIINGCMGEGTDSPDVYKIDSNTKDVIKFIATAGYTYIQDGFEIWGGKWAIIDSNLFNANCGSEFEVDDFTDWSKSTHALTPARSNTEKYQGTYSGKFGCAATQTGWNKYSITVENDKKYYIAACLNNDNLDAFKVQVSSNDTTWSDMGSALAMAGWTVCGNYYTTTSTTLYIRVYMDNTSEPSTSYGYIDNLYIGKLSDQDLPTNAYGDDNGYAGINTIINDDWLLDNDNGYAGYRILVGTSSDGNNDTNASITKVINNVKKAIKGETDITTFNRGVTQRTYLCRNYIWVKEDTNEVALHFYDDGITVGSAHPLEGTTSIKINGEFAKVIQGTLFQYGLIIDPGGENDVYNDYFSYSYNGSARQCIDINPAGNIWHIPDREGGEATGLAESYGSPVFFKRHAIFKLYMNNIYDSSTWRLRESLYNTGNVAKHGIVEVGNDVYYCAYDGIYKLNPNVGAETDATPMLRNKITLSIEDVYQALTYGQKKAIEGVFDQLNSEIIWRFTDDDIWAFNTKTGEWRTIDSNYKVDLMTYDENGNVIIFDDTNHIVSAIDTAESIKTALRTGEFLTSEIRPEPLRRVTITYKSESALTFNIYSNDPIIEGFITVGEDYIIQGNTGADFTRAGAANNNIGTSFTATATMVKWGIGGELRQTSPIHTETLPIKKVMGSDIYGIRKLAQRFEVEIKDDSNSSTETELSEILIN